MKLIIYFLCTKCGQIFDGSDRGYNLNYQYGHPAICDKCQQGGSK